MTGTLKPAEALVGLTLDGGWTVDAQIPRRPGSSGGNFSVGYSVSRPSGGGTDTAFLKAVDLTAALGMPGSIIDNIQLVTSHYAHERDLVIECTGRRLDHVVRNLASGEVAAPVDQVDPTMLILKDVPYLIFEDAPQGDVRSALIAGLVAFDDAWAFRMLHGAAVGLSQLHQNDIAHQDLKPSNVMVFGKGAKVGDLGRASKRATHGPFDAFPVPGDMNHAPPELLYGHLLTDERIRRRSADMYQLGSLIPFFFSGSTLTGLLMSRLNGSFHWRVWQGDYKSALPYIRQAFNEALLDVEGALPDSCRSELMGILRELTDPDPELRGSKRSGSGLQQFALGRYVSVFDRLAYRAEGAVRTLITAP